MKRAVFLTSLAAQAVLLPLAPAGIAGAQGVELPAGRLRLGNVAGSQTAPIAAELGRAFAARLGVGFEEIVYASDVERTAALSAGAWDLGSAARPNAALDPLLDYSPAYLEIDGTYLVPAGSPIQRVADADRPGTRIAATRGSAPDTHLSQALRQATLVRGDNQAAAFELLRSGQADAFGGLRPNLLALAPQLPGSRVLADRFSVQETSLGVPKGRPALAAALNAFVISAKASGLVRQAIARAGVQGVQEAAATLLPRTGAGYSAARDAGIFGAALLLAGLATISRRKFVSGA